MRGVFGGWAGWTGLGRLRVVGWIKCGAGLVRQSFARVGNVPSSWSRFLAEGAVWLNAQEGEREADCDWNTGAQVQGERMVRLSHRDDRQLGPRSGITVDRHQGCTVDRHSIRLVDCSLARQTDHSSVKRRSAISPWEGLHPYLNICHVCAVLHPPLCSETPSPPSTETAPTTETASLPLPQSQQPEPQDISTPATTSSTSQHTDPTPPPTETSPHSSPQNTSQPNDPIPVQPTEAQYIHLMKTRAST
ncbi:hypothetical protein F2Q69_00019930 [Brassica cretica]|uniref:Uncharacterized protein n=1 Tax=Brassica cretica TaxID=69181 RepID=A0A8S9QPS1_BRACR|nr:hypothetical protein F2Q69_00019930 [Brassica cretica]